MINFSNITGAIKTLLESDSDLVTTSIDIADIQITSENHVGDAQISIFRGILDYTPRTLGRSPQSYNAVGEVIIAVQTANLESGEAAEISNENIVKSVLDTLTGDTTRWGCTIDNILSINVTYDFSMEPEDHPSLYYHLATLTIKFEVKTQ